MSDQTTYVSQLREEVQQFVIERDWQQFHAPKNLAMSLAVEAAELKGEIRDDGVGFDPPAHEPDHGGGMAVGLLGMNERVGLLGGGLNIESEPGGGTKISFTVPLDRGVADA